MKFHKSVAILALMACAGSALAESSYQSTEALGRGLKNSVNAITDTTRGTSNAADSKIVAAAREDAASFVASEGAIRSVRLEAALQHLRQDNAMQASDMQLAEAILNL